MDPISASILAGAAGGVAGKAVETVVDLANKTFRSRFAEQRDATRKQALDNVQDLISKIEEGFEQIAASNAAIKEQIDTTLSSPAFAIFTQTALFNGMKTESRVKHVLLARLVIECLQSLSESVLASASEMACNAIAGATATELRVLGLRSTLDRLDPSSIAHLAYPENTNLTALEWVTELLSPYKALSYTSLDVMHLHALGCLRGQTGMLASDLGTVVSGRGRLPFGLKDFEATEVGAHVSNLWTNRLLVFADLNSVGLLIGIYVSDILYNTVSDLSAWRR